MARLDRARSIGLRQRTCTLSFGGAAETFTRPAGQPAYVRPLVGVSDAYMDRFERLAIRRGIREEEMPIGTLTERDIAICETIHHLRFASSDQLAEIHWPGRSRQAADRRLLMLFRAGLVDRLRPRGPTGGGSFPWCYSLARRGQELLTAAGRLPAQPFRPRRVSDFGYVVHDLHVNAWVLAYRRHVGDRLLGWTGETEAFTAPEQTAALHRPVRPDAILDVRLATGKEASMFVELDRTRRPEKNFEKLERYDAFLTRWADELPVGKTAGGALALFVCPDEPSLARFLRAAHRRLTLQLRGVNEHPGRLRTFFAVEDDIHAGRLRAWRVSATPVDRRVRESLLPGVVGE